MSDERTLAGIEEALTKALAAPTADGFVAVAALHNDLKKLSARENPEGYVECLLKVAQLFYHYGRAMLGVEPANRASIIARGLDRRVLRKALVFQRILQSESFEIDSAIRSLVEGLRISQEINEGQLVVSAWNNLGTPLAITGRRVSKRVWRMRWQAGPQSRGSKMRARSEVKRKES